MDKKYLTRLVGSVIITISKITNHISDMINGGDSMTKKERVTAAIREKKLYKIPSGFPCIFLRNQLLETRP